jgi:hypothetical protein
MFSMDPQQGTSCGTMENILNSTLQGLGFAPLLLLHLAKVTTCHTITMNTGSWTFALQIK